MDAVSGRKDHFPCSFHVPLEEWILHGVQLHKVRLDPRNLQAERGCLVLRSANRHSEQQADGQDCKVPHKVYPLFQTIITLITAIWGLGETTLQSDGYL